MPLLQISPISQLHLQASHSHPLALLNCGTAQDMSLRLAGCSTVVMIGRWSLLTKVFPMTLTGQTSYVEEEAGVVFGPADKSRVNMTTITRKITLPCISPDPANYLLSTPKCMPTPQSCLKDLSITSQYYFSSSQYHLAKTLENYLKRENADLGSCFSEGTDHFRGHCPQLLVPMCLSRTP